ncbi:hypothetical protein HYW75_03900 [Candidatus Pacearchaeota archaeon]|nr:hypothetical protein [Candidatus Pacearchaeota archaeon]
MPGNKYSIIDSTNKSRFNNIHYLPGEPRHYSLVVGGLLLIFAAYRIIDRKIWNRQKV